MKQKSFMRIKSGSLGEITFVGSKDGYRLQEKKEMNSGRFKTDPAFERVRELNSEFAVAASACKVLRNVLKPVIKLAKDGRLVSRMQTVMLQVLKGDTISNPGGRNPIDGETWRLIGFEFNQDSKTTDIFHRAVPYTINRVSGELAISIAPFVPADYIVAPSGVSHFELVTAGVEVSFEQKTAVLDVKTTGLLPFTNVPTAAINAVVNVTPTTQQPVILVFGIRFHVPINNGTRPYLKGRHDAFRILGLTKV